jgi:uncharacterized protein (DUF2236 family)
VNREGVLLLGGGRALLLQVAHPLIAAGVAAHSGFRQQPLQRLVRTLELTLTITFAGAAQAIAAVRKIERVHARVHGRLRSDVGPFPRGTLYDANDPELLFWVHATLVDTALLVYERFVEPLPPRAKAAYYEESKTAARLFGIPQSLIPETLRDFRHYMQRMLAGDTLAVDDDAREIAAAIFHPPGLIALQPAFGLANFFTVGLLPPVLRARYGLAWGPVREAALQAAAGIALRTVHRLPNLARTFPHARRAAGG